MLKYVFIYYVAYFNNIISSIKVKSHAQLSNNTWAYGCTWSCFSESIPVTLDLVIVTPSLPHSCVLELLHHYATSNRSESLHHFFTHDSHSYFITASLLTPPSRIITESLLTLPNHVITRRSWPLESLHHCVTADPCSPCSRDNSPFFIRSSYYLQTRTVPYWFRYQ